MHSIVSDGGAGCAESKPHAAARTQIVHGFRHLPKFAALSLVGCISSAVGDVFCSTPSAICSRFSHGSDPTCKSRKDASAARLDEANTEESMLPWGCSGHVFPPSISASFKNTGKDARFNRSSMKLGNHTCRGTRTTCEIHLFVTERPDAANINVETPAPSSKIFSIVILENRDGSGEKAGYDAGGSRESTDPGSDDDDVPAIASKLVVVANSNSDWFRYCLDLIQ